MLESLSDFLAPPRVLAILAFLRGAFCAAAVALVLRACFHFAPYRIGHRVRLMLFPLLFCAAAAATLAYQARWQLLGFTDRRFVAYMERHNVRPDNAAHHLFRGSLLDRAGRPLAYTDPDGSGRRVYPYEAAAAHVVGFRHPSEGLTGMEGAADDLLSGWRQLATAQDVREAGRTALQGADRHIGTNLTLTVDARLQLRAHTLLAGRRGAAVALDPRSGEVLLLCSSPSFDPNRYDHRLNVDAGRPPPKPLWNRALHRRYPPGSTFKAAIAALMVERRVPLEIDCPGDGYRLKTWGRPIRDHEYYAYERKGAVWPGFGRIGLDTALAKSSNVYFAHGGVLCGTEAFNAMAERLRLRERVLLYTNGAHRVSAIAPNCPPLGRAELRELAQRSFGQGELEVTPLHMAMIVGAIANHGLMMAPRLALDAAPEPLGRVFPERAADRVAAAMRNAVKAGTARRADLPGIDVRGKTGTAQNAPGRDSDGADHSWFVCFASRPGEEPSIAVAVVVENAGFGSAAALPVAVGILEEFFRAP